MPELCHSGYSEGSHHTSLCMYEKSMFPPAHSYLYHIMLLKAIYVAVLRWFPNQVPIDLDELSFSMVAALCIFRPFIQTMKTSMSRRKILTSPSVCQIFLIFLLFCEGTLNYVHATTTTTCGMTSCSLGSLSSWELRCNHHGGQP